MKEKLVKTSPAYSLYIIWTTYQDLLQVQDHKNENDSQGTF